MSKEPTKITDNRICCLCKKVIVGDHHNAQPVARGICCTKCNYDFVVPSRLKAIRRSESK